MKVYAIFFVPLFAILAVAGPVMEKSNQVANYLEKRQVCEKSTI